jgi:hypothetical protein
MRAIRSTAFTWKTAIPRMVMIIMPSTHPFCRPSPPSLILRSGGAGLLRRAPVVVALLCTLIFVLFACSGEHPESFYPSLSDADRDGAMTRGWIPDFLPESSTGIHEVHNIEGGKTWCAFEFSPGDSERLRHHLRSAEVLPASLKYIRNPSVSWWPPLLIGNVEADRVRRAGFDLYMVTSPDTRSNTETMLFAIDWSKGRGFFYRGHE